MGLVAEQAQAGGVGRVDETVGAKGDDGVHRGVEHAAQAGLAGGQRVLGLAQRLGFGLVAPRRQPQFEGVDHRVRQIGESLDLLGVEPAGLVVDGAQRPDIVARAAAQRRPGVKTDMGRAEHQRVGGEAGVGQGVLHHQHPFIVDGPATKGLLARHLAGLKAEGGLEPGAPFIDQRHQHDRHPGECGTQPGDAVKGRFRRRIEDVVGPQSLEACGLRRRSGRTKHRLTFSFQADFDPRINPFPKPGLPPARVRLL